MKDHPPGSALALAAGIVSLPLCLLPPVGGVFAIIALVLALAARRRARAEPDRFRDSAMPSAAQVCGLVGLVMSCALFVLYGALMAAVHGPAAVAAEPPVTF